jgi:hypothetical protein
MLNSECGMIYETHSSPIPLTSLATHTETFSAQLASLFDPEATI